MAYTRVAVNVPAVTGEFDYHLSPELEGQVGKGHLVTVPFGHQIVQGVVLDLVSVPAIAETKPVLSMLDSEPVLTAAQIELARQLSDATLNSLAAMVDLMLPPGLSQQADILLTLGNQQLAADEVGQVQKRLLKLLRERGPLRGRQIDRHFKNVDWRKVVDWLVKRGVLDKKSVLPPPSVRPKFIRVAQLAVSPEVAETAMNSLGKTEATLSRRQAALRYLIKEVDEVNVSWVYAASNCKLADLQLLAEMDLIALRESEIWRDPTERLERGGLEQSENLVLTTHQQGAWGIIKSAFADSQTRPHLLKGVTGSGKTELYIRAAQEAIRRGKQAIILIPEIALTPQTVRRFLARFPGQVGVIHSKLSVGERYDTWRRARAGMLKVVIGPRSALFTPFPNIGLIVADECHDSSYYQSEPPFYHAIRAAEIYASLCGAVCILGSATPSIEQKYRVETGQSSFLELPERISADKTEPAQGLDLPPVHIIDMRGELKSGNRGIFSRTLIESLAGTLERGEQAILFLNRRGTATYVFCRECGYAIKCPQCDSPLTYHVGGGERLTCHRCGYTRQKPQKCPECGSTQIREYGLGSERVEAEVGAMFPKARVLRWDWETTRQKDAHEIILSHFASGRADVLVGTQMLAKGLDLPRVTLVGIVLAEVGLNLPDPFAAERVFQVLTQVAGRAGRSSLGGKVILQTFQPEHYAIQFAAGHDVDRFYQHELAERRRLGYPPFSHLVRLEYRDRDPHQAEAEARRLAERLNSLLEIEDRRQTTVIGPVPCFFEKVGGMYRWQIILRGPNPVEIVRNQKLDSWRVEVEPVSLL